MPRRRWHPCAPPALLLSRAASDDTPLAGIHVANDGDPHFQQLLNVGGGANEKVTGTSTCDGDAN